MIETTCFGQLWPSSGFFIRKICMLYEWLETRLHALYNHSYGIQIFRMKNLMMANVGRNM